MHQVPLKGESSLERKGTIFHQEKTALISFFCVFCIEQEFPSVLLLKPFHLLIFFFSFMPNKIIFFISKHLFSVISF